MAGYSKIAFSGLNYIFTASLPGYKEIETAKVSSASFNTWTTLAFIERVVRKSKGFTGKIYFQYGDQWSSSHS